MKEYYKILKDEISKGELERRTSFSSGEESLYRNGELIAKSTGYMEENVIKETIALPPTLVLFGFGHIGKAIYKLSSLLNISLFIFDDRKEAIKDGDYEKATIVIDSFDNIFKRKYSFENPYFLIFTHGHIYDEESLYYVLNNYDSDYIGMIGSKRKIDLTYSNLEKRGLDKEALLKVHSPIGVKINAKSPEEIAISIMAEVIETYRRDKAVITIDSRLIDEIINEKNSAVIARIIEKEGSGPREKGSEMLITKERTYSTIGGGAIEKRCMEIARKMLDENIKFHIEDFTLKENEPLNMACGGRAKVMFKTV